MKAEILKLNAEAEIVMGQHAMPLDDKTFITHYYSIFNRLTSNVDHTRLGRLNRRIDELTAAYKPVFAKIARRNPAVVVSITPAVKPKLTTPVAPAPMPIVRQTTKPTRLSGPSTKTSMPVIKARSGWQYYSEPVVAPAVVIADDEIPEPTIRVKTPRAVKAPAAITSKTYYKKLAKKYKNILDDRISYTADEIDQDDLFNDHFMGFMDLTRELSKANAKAELDMPHPTGQWTSLRHLVIEAGEQLDKLIGTHLLDNPHKVSDFKLDFENFNLTSDAEGYDVFYATHITAAFDGLAVSINPRALAWLASRAA